MHRVLFVALTSALCVTAFSSSFAAEKVRGKTIIGSGCTSWRVPFCTVVNTGKTTYALEGASPSIPVGVGISFVGEKLGDFSPCFVPVVKVISWKPNKMKCPK
jgi:hypothetical protein